MNFRQFGGGAAGDATSFSDTLQPPDQPFIWGDLYQNVMYSTGGVTCNADQLAGKINRSGSGLTFTGGGGGSLICKAWGIPRTLSFLSVDGKNQFAQVNYVSDSSAGVSCNVVGLSLFCQCNKSLCYSVYKNPQGTTAGVALVKTIVGVDTVLGAVHAIAANDLVRIEVRASGGTNTLKLLVNGVVLETQTDNAITPGGLPALSCPELFTGGQTTVLANFSCGLLTT